MVKLDDIYNAYPDELFLSADGLEDALIGLDQSTGRLIYSVKKCLEIFILQGMTYEEAVEYFEYNTREAYVGEKTPIWCEDDF
jgi:hypothetical protein